MSEIVKELYRKSIDETVQMHKDSPHCIAWSWEEKFAELIVLECLKVLKDQLPVNLYEWNSDTIKNKFGIK